MPLPPPATGRTKVHTRQVICEGYLRDDGQWDIDGWITDVKEEAYRNFDRGEIPAGTPLHGMGLRITIDDKYTITDAVAVQDFTPYTICPQVTPAFKKLIGISLTRGFKRHVRELLGGVQG